MTPTALRAVIQQAVHIHADRLAADGALISKKEASPLSSRKLEKKQQQQHHHQEVDDLSIEGLERQIHAQRRRIEERYGRNNPRRGQGGVLATDDESDAIVLASESTAPPVDVRRSKWAQKYRDSLNEKRDRRLLGLKPEG